MGFPSRQFLTCLLGVAAFATMAFADTHERTQFGHDITVGSDETASDVTCFACSVRVRGHVDGDVTTFGGNVVIERDAVVAGDTTIFGGDLRLDNDTSVKDITVFGGRIRRDPEASVTGDITTFGGGAAFWLFLIFGLPFVILGAFIAFLIWLIRRFSRPAVPVTARV